MHECRMLDIAVCLTQALNAALSGEFRASPKATGLGEAAGMSGFLERQPAPGVQMWGTFVGPEAPALQWSK